MPEESFPIPRIIHRIWLGPNPLPEEFERYGETWKHHHPDWDIRLWTDTEVAELELPEAFHRSRDVCERADVLRMELVRRFGGLHVDTDIECLRPLDPLLKGVKAFAAYDDPDDTIISGALMGAVPGHPAMERAVREVHDSVGSGHIVDATGPRFLTPIFAEDPELVAFPHELFHPYRFSEPWRKDEEFPDAYAVHHWSHLWVSPETLLDRVQKKRQKVRSLKKRLEISKKREKQLADRLAKTERRLATAERRLTAVERSRWWRLGRRLRRLRLLRRLASRLPR